MIEIPLDPQEAIAVLSSISRFGTLPETRAMREWMRQQGREDGWLRMPGSR